MTIWPGARRFLLGNIVEYSKYEQAVKESPEPFAGPMVWLCQQFAKKYQNGRFDTAKHPVIVQNMFGQPVSFISDPKAVQEMFTSKSTIVDKEETGRKIFKDWMKDGIILSSATDEYKAKRKHASQAFMRDQLVKMQESFKRLLSNSFTEWSQQIESSQSKSTIVDIRQVFGKILQKNIIINTFGVDIAEEPIELMMPSAKNPNVYEKVQIPLRLALE